MRAQILRSYHKKSNRKSDLMRLALQSTKKLLRETIVLDDRRLILRPKTQASVAD